MKERISALMDEGIDDSDVGGVLDGLSQDREAIEAWRVYHLIGDCLRGHDKSPAGSAIRVMAALEMEPTVFAPRSTSRAHRSVTARWVLPLAASLMGVAAVGWVAQSLNGPQSGSTIAQTAQPVPVAATASPAPVAAVVPVKVEPQVSPLPVPARFDREYLIAHQGFSPSGSISGVAQYVRTVAETREEPVR